MKTILAALPLLSVLIVGGLYIAFDQTFVKCENGSNCPPVEGNMISDVKDAATQSNRGQRLAEIEKDINGLPANLSQKRKELANIQANIYKKDVEIANSNFQLQAVYGNASANTNVIAARDRAAAAKEKETADKSLREHEANIVSEKIQNGEKEAIAIRKQFSARYSTRMLWMFLSAILIILCFASLFTAAYLIYRSERAFYASGVAIRKTLWWLSMPFFASVFLGIYAAYFPEQFGSVTLQILKTSVIGVNEVSVGSIVFFIAATFFCAMFLITASCAIFRTALDVKSKIPAIPEGATEPPVPETEDILQRQEIYADSLKFLRTVLYVGTGLLFVGILRLYFLHQWHLAFVSTDPTNESYKLLSEFFTTSMEVQGALYTIMLAAIYIVPAYWIKEEAASITEPGEMAKKGLEFSYSDLVFRLLAILSPLLAGSFGGEMLKVFGTG